MNRRTLKTLLLGVEIFKILMEEKMISDNNRYRYVKTRPIQVEVVMVEGIRVEGYLHLTTDHRLVDQLNNQTKETPFVALTDAKVYLPGQECRQYDFFTVNRYKIICCIPKEA